MSLSSMNCHKLKFHSPSGQGHVIKEKLSSDTVVSALYRILWILLQLTSSRSQQEMLKPSIERFCEQICIYLFIYLSW